jgi:hypothetical protein
MSEGRIIPDIKRGRGDFRFAQYATAKKRSLCQTPNKNSLLGERHSEDNLRYQWSPVLLKPAGARYAVEIKVRRCLLRPLREGEVPPEGAKLSRMRNTIFVTEPLLPEEHRRNAGYILRGKRRRSSKK